MTYGTIKVDTVTFTDAGVDKSVTLSGLVQNPTFSGNVTVTGTLSGVTVTGTTANFTSGNFTNISGGTHTITSGVFAAGSAASPSITFTGDLNTGIYSPGADQVAISTGGSGRLFVDASGNVGVATGAPSYRLEVNGTISQSSQGTSSALIQAVNAGGIFYHGLDNSAGTTFGQAYAAALWHSGAYPILFATNGTERLRITSAGLVGIGTSSPSGLLHVAGQIYSSGTGYTGTNSPTLRLINSTATTGRTFGINSADSGIFQVFDASAGDATRLCVDSSGRLGIGTTSPAYPLHVVGAITSRNATADMENMSIGFTETGSGLNYSVRIGQKANTVLAFEKYDGAWQETVRIDGSGRVGIGTSSPAKLLEVNEGDIQIRNSSTASINTLLNYGLAFRSTNQIGQDRGTIAEIKPYLGGAGDNDFGLQFRTQATTGGGVTTKMTLTPGGSLGIGTTSADARLTVQDGTNNIAKVKSLSFDNYANEGIGVAFGRTSDGADVMAIGVVDTDKLIAAGREGILFATGGGGLYSAATERARIDSSGRLLVGTSSGKTVGAGQYSLLNVQGYVGASNGGGDVTLSRGETAANITTGEVLGFISFTDSDGYAFGQFYCEADGTAGTNNYPGRLVFTTTADGASSPTERMRINKNGEILFGTSTTTNGCKLALVNTDATRKWGFGTIGTNTYFAVVDDTSGAGVQLNAGSTSWSTFSDERLKDNLAPIQDGLDKVSQLRAVTGRYKTDDINVSRSFLIAQDVQAVLPEAVDIMSDDMRTLSLKYTEVIPLLVSALKESKERIETLEAKVVALESA